MAYDPTFVDILTGATDEDARQKAQVMAQQLRGDKTLGLMGLGGGRLAAPLGKEMLSDVEQGEKGLLSAGVNRLHYGQQAQDLKRQLADEQTRRMLEVQGLKNEGAINVALARLAGMGAKPAKPVPGKEVDTLQGMNESLRNIDSIVNQFRPEFAGQGMLGRAKNWSAQVLGSWAPESAQKQNEFWAAFKMLSELPDRHKFFGSALTPTEAASWREAQNITPGTSPDIIERKFEWMRQTAQDKLNRRAAEVKAAGFNPEQVDIVAPRAQPIEAGGKPVMRSKSGRPIRQNAQGQWEYY